MTDTFIEKSIFLKSSREEVWAYLTQPDLLAKWFHLPKVPLSEGAPLEMFGATSGDKLIWGEVKTARAPEFLEYTFTVGPMGDAVSNVQWTLIEVPGGTRLHLMHTGLPQGADAFDLTLAMDKGWDDHIGRMRAHLHGEAEE